MVEGGLHLLPFIPFTLLATLLGNEGPYIIWCLGNDSLWIPLQVAACVVHNVCLDDPAANSNSKASANRDQGGLRKHQTWSAHLGFGQ
jgi:hypothetical protein